MDFDKLFADITGVVDAIASLIDALGGWEVAAVALIGLLSGDKALPSPRSWAAHRRPVEPGQRRADPDGEC